MFTLTSSAFKDGGMIPDGYVEDSSVSPPHSISCILRKDLHRLVS